ncbi:uncharacterized protein LOC132272849 [Cornus florida]|uniref:uncharacterized protein LOC132272849 n=1 Tax=Cornus florida TaxID=4283 RepID=UPI0028A1B075|nr:uncharacterized protein LOC132272849 [Cornus florida]
MSDVLSLVTNITRSSSTEPGGISLRRPMNEDEHIPLTLAAIYDNKPTLKSLRGYHTTKDDGGKHGYFRELIGSLFLDDAVNKIMFTKFIKTEKFDLALKHLECEYDSNVIKEYLKENLNRMAIMVFAFSSGNQLGYFKSLTYMSIRLRFVKRVTSNVAKAMDTKAGRAVKGIYWTEGCDRINFKSKLCFPIWTFDPEYAEIYVEAIKIAIKYGNGEFVEEVLRSNPAFLWGDKKSGTIFHIALASHQEKIWNLIYGLTIEQKNRATGTLVESNSMLHIAAYPLVDVPDEALQKKGEQQ